MSNRLFTRRTFAKSSAAATLGLVTLPHLAAARESSTPLPSTWQKQGLVIGPELVPEGERLQNFTSPAVPLDDDRWRIWCSRSGKTSPKRIGFAEGTVHDPVSWQFTWAELTAGDPINDAPLSIGNLPAGWQPIQVVRVPLGEGRERLYFWAHGPNIVRYLAADSNDGRRFRVVDPLRPCLYHPADRAVNGPVTRLKRFARRQAKPEPGEPLAEFEHICNDATNVYRLPDGTFEMYTVSLVEVPKESPAYIAYDNIAGCQRVIHRLTSDDGLRWTNRRPVIAPDKHDPDDQQFYYLSVTHTPQGRYGLLGHYRCAAQTIDLEYCYSADGLKWERPLRKPLIERGAAPSLDGYLLHAPHSVVRHAGKWHLFYTGNNFKHNHSESFGPEQRAIFLATADELWSSAANSRT